MPTKLEQACDPKKITKWYAGVYIELLTSMIAVYEKEGS